MGVEWQCWNNIDWSILWWWRKIGKGEKDLDPNRGEGIWGSQGVQPL